MCMHNCVYTASMRGWTKPVESCTDGISPVARERRNERGVMVLTSSCCSVVQHCGCRRPQSFLSRQCLRKCTSVACAPTGSRGRQVINLLLLSKASARIRAAAPEVRCSCVAERTVQCTSPAEPLISELLPFAAQLPPAPRCECAT